MWTVGLWWGPHREAVVYVDNKNRAMECMGAPAGLFFGVFNCMDLRLLSKAWIHTLYILLKQGRIHERAKQARNCSV